MKNSIFSFAILKNIISLSFVILGFLACQKKEIAGKYLAAVLENPTVADIKTTDAKISSQITASSTNAVIIDYGFCFDLTDKVTVETAKKVSLGAVATDKLPITTVLTGLKPNTKYYARAYLIDAKQTNYSSLIDFTTANLQPPKVTITDPSEITNTTFSISGKITELGTSDISQHGHVISETNKEPTTADAPTKLGTATAPKDFKSTFSVLKAGTTYYIRAYATNATGTSYSDVKTVKTLNPILPNVVSSDLGGYGPTKVSAYGSFTAFGSSQIVSEYGFVLSSTNQIPTIADTKALAKGTPVLNSIFQADFINLKANTNYYLRAFGTTADGTGYGKVMTFKTPDFTPPTFGVLPQPDKNYCTNYLSDWASNKTDFTKVFDGYCYGNTPYKMPPQVKVSFSYTASPNDEIASIGVCVIPNSSLYLVGYQPTITDAKIDNTSKASVWNLSNNFQGTFNLITYTTTNQACNGKRFYSNYFIFPYEPNVFASTLSLSYSYRPYIIGKSGNVYYGQTQKYTITTTASPYCVTVIN
jgi:hypothetical protein